MNCCWKRRPSATPHMLYFQQVLLTFPMGVLAETRSCYRGFKLEWSYPQWWLGSHLSFMPHLEACPPKLSTTKLNKFLFWVECHHWELQNVWPQHTNENEIENNPANISCLLYHLQDCPHVVWLYCGSLFVASRTLVIRCFACHFSTSLANIVRNIHTGCFLHAASYVILTCP